MLKLIYYKIETPKGFKEGNAVIETETNIMSKDEWKKFNCDARDRHDSYNRPIIMNIMDIRE